ncbi:Sensor histidine kinase LiaS [Streptomyces sp. YIM 130001]|uniref:sensor histidine kinase n=1 Tax=Streptomyces sp. YIM 130001 TaxID=2259644 RepID=UPI000E647E2E|nr:sensor histidine kinase [Streptomyces sp. YIM 130001]RII13464.1 Sensor histidine kinase LiaS [Streptomyces sp. YIM 130001]
MTITPPTGDSTVRNRLTTGGSRSQPPARTSGPERHRVPDEERRRVRVEAENAVLRRAVRQLAAQHRDMERQLGRVCSDLGAAAARVSAFETQARESVRVAKEAAENAEVERFRAEWRAADAERARDEAAEAGAAQERRRIARDLHDSLTHQLAVITVQADAAVQIARRHDAPVPEHLPAIRTAGRDAARELRATLSELRGRDDTPCQGVEQLPELLARVRATGLDATLTVDGAPRVLSRAVGEAVYRVVQESLTNTMRHAAASAVSVRVEYRQATVAVAIDDDGRRTADDVRPPRGTGLSGMRERVLALGGRFRAEPRTSRGFTVRAELPAGPVL